MQNPLFWPPSTRLVAMVDLAELITTRSLVLGMVRSDYTLEAAELYDVGVQCGFTTDQIRLCLARLVRQGLFTQAGRGRHATFRATDKGQREIEPQDNFIRLAWAQDAAHWEGIWYLAGFTIDEGRRNERNALRDQIVNLYTGAAVANGLFVSPHFWDSAVSRIARKLGVEDRIIFIHSTELTIAGEKEPRALAGLLWDLEGLAARWAEFVKNATISLSQQSDTTDPTAELAAVVSVVAHWWKILQDDPLLPPDLLPPDWQGVEARRLFAETTYRIQTLRENAQIPTLFRRFDAVMGEISSGFVEPLTTRRD